MWMPTSTRATQAQLQAQQAQQAQQAALAQAFAQAAAGATNPMTPGMMPPGVAPGVSPGVAPGVAPGMPMTPGVVPMTPGVPVGADPRQALLQGLVTAQAQSGDPRAAVLQQVLNAHTAQAAAQAAYTPQMPLPTAPSQTVQGLQGQPVAQPVAAGGLQSMDWAVQHVQQWQFREPWSVLQCMALHGTAWHPGLENPFLVLMSARCTCHQPVPAYHLAV